MARRSTTPKVWDIKFTRPAEPEGIWIGARDGRSWEIKFGDLRIVVHRHVDYPPDQWLMTCDGVRVGPRTLESTDIEAAKREAFNKVFAMVQAWSRKMAAFCEEHA